MEGWNARGGALDKFPVSGRQGVLTLGVLML